MAAGLCLLPGVACARLRRLGAFTATLPSPLPVATREGRLRTVMAALGLTAACYPNLFCRCPACWRPTLFFREHNALAHARSLSLVAGSRGRGVRGGLG